MKFPVYNPEDPAGFNTYPAILNVLGLDTGLYFHYLVYCSQKEHSWQIVTSIPEIARQFYQTSRYSVQKSLNQLEDKQYIKKQQTRHGLVINLSPTWESQMTHEIHQEEANHEYGNG